jgi:hypothetical protein
MKILRPLIFYFISCFLTIIFQSCEGFKILTIQNKTDKNIYIQTKPEIPYSRDNSTEVKFQPRAESKTYLIMPDSSLGILSNFTGLLFNRKFREGQLTIDYLLIATPTDTIVAKNRQEIIDFINNSPNNQNKLGDKNYIVGNKRNVITINARQ